MHRQINLPETIWLLTISNARGAMASLPKPFLNVALAKAYVERWSKGTVVWEDAEGVYHFGTTPDGLWVFEIREATFNPVLE